MGRRSLVDGSDRRAEKGEVAARRDGDGGDGRRRPRGERVRRERLCGRVPAVGDRAAGVARDHIRPMARGPPVITHATLRKTALARLAPRQSRSRRCDDASARTGGRRRSRTLVSCIERRFVSRPCDSSQSCCADQMELRRSVRSPPAERRCVCPPARGEVRGRVIGVCSTGRGGGASAHPARRPRAARRRGSGRASAAPRAPRGRAAQRARQSVGRSTTCGENCRRRPP